MSTRVSDMVAVDPSYDVGSEPLPTTAVRRWGLPLQSLTAELTAITVFSLVGAYSAAFLLGTRMPNLAQKYAGWSVVGLVLIGGIVVLIHTLRLMVQRDPHPLAKVLAISRAWITPSFLLDKVLPIFLVFGFLAAFSIFKSLIPTMHPFAWDSAFSDLDRLIFGTDPWRLTHAIIGSSATRFLDYAYVMWMPVFTCVVFYHSVFANAEQKRRFFLSFFGCWIILGIIAATIFSSVGPCFLGLISHPYAERYSFFPLADGHYSQWIMNYLGNGYVTGDYGTAKGISAMPSMHIAVVTLYVVAARKWWTLALSIAYFVLIFVGSIHLGWHYAVDGIAAALGTVAIYKATSRKRVPAGSERSTQLLSRPELAQL